MPDQPGQSPTLAKPNKKSRSARREQTDNVGSYNRSTEYEDGIGSDSTRLTDYASIESVMSYVIGMKARRSIYYFFELKDWQLDGLFYFYSLMKLAGRVDLPLFAVVDFSGRGRNWRAASYKAARANVASMLLEWVPKKGGKVLRLTAKGEGVINTYRAKFEEIKTQFFNKPSKRWRDGQPGSAQRMKHKEAA